MCVLITYEIINSACITYQFNNPVTGFGTGQSCSTATMPMTQATCSALIQ
ncbi:hypothetical protein KKG31_08330 [Patescibacteria group bacterium]|nr:hypothetical protein [Patescibacteria group bacterium]MBU1759063.1 hypothetical protein [Patescibacteria group bacterium]